MPRRGWRLDGQIGRILFGVFLIIAGLVVKRLDEDNTVIVSYVCDGAPTSIACYAAHLSFVTLGLGAVWTILILAGVFYAVVYDWMLGVLQGLFRDVVEQAGNVANVWLPQIRANRLSREELRQVFSATLASIMARGEQTGAEFAEFVFDGIASRPSATWRRGHQSVVTIEQIEPANPLAARYFRYRESTAFEIVGSEPGASHPFRFDAGLEASEEELATLVGNFEYVISYNSVQLKFSAVRGDIDMARVRSATGWEQGAFGLRYANRILHFKVRHSVPVGARSVSITADETSLILRSDKEYAKVLNEPALGFTFRLTVPPGHEVVLALASVDRFEWHPGQALGNAVASGERDVHVTAPWWALPGIAAFVVWREKPPHVTNPAAALLGAAEKGMHADVHR
jgi:hypothetical protein